MARQPAARDFLPKALEKAGAQVDEVAPYIAEKATESGLGIREAIQSGRVSGITFTSSQIAKNFYDLLGVSGRRALKSKGSQVKIFSIGPITSKMARSLGFQLAGEAKVYTIQGLVDCMTQKIGNKTKG